MKITADANILVRALTDDDPMQSPRAQAELAQAELVRSRRRFCASLSGF